MGKTHPVRLDRPRELRYTTTSMRLLDRELTQLYGHSAMHYIQQIGLEFAEKVAQPDTGVMHYDVMALFLKYGLRHKMTGLTDQDTDRMIEEAKASEVEIWGAIADAYTDARGLRLEPEEGEEGEGDEEVDPYADPTASPKPAPTASSTT